MSKAAWLLLFGVGFLALSAKDSNATPVAETDTDFATDADGNIITIPPSANINIRPTGEYIMNERFVKPLNNLQ
jgi:hypothetical protein